MSLEKGRRVTRPSAAPHLSAARHFSCVDATAKKRTGHDKVRDAGTHRSTFVSTARCRQDRHFAILMQVGSAFGRDQTPVGLASSIFLPRAPRLLEMLGPPSALAFFATFYFFPLARGTVVGFRVEFLNVCLNAEAVVDFALGQRWTLPRLRQRSTPTYQMAPATLLNGP